MRRGVNFVEGKSVFSSCSLCFIVLRESDMDRLLEMRLECTCAVLSILVFLTSVLLVTCAQPGGALDHVTSQTHESFA